MIGIRLKAGLKSFCVLFVVFQHMLVALCKNQIDLQKILGLRVCSVTCRRPIKILLNGSALICHCLFSTLTLFAFSALVLMFQGFTSKHCLQISGLRNHSVM